MLEKTDKFLQVRYQLVVNFFRETFGWSKDFLAGCLTALFALFVGIDACFFEESVQFLLGVGASTSFLAVSVMCFRDAARKDRSVLGVVESQFDVPFLDAFKMVWLLFLALDFLMMLIPEVESLGESITDCSGAFCIISFLYVIACKDLPPGKTRWQKLKDRVREFVASLRPTLAPVPIPVGGKK